MGYHVIHMIEAAEWIEESKYYDLVKQCGQLYQYLAGNEACDTQLCMTFADTVKEIPTKGSVWPGDKEFRRSRRRKNKESQQKKVCFEDMLNVVANHMMEGSAGILILYTDGAIKRSKKTLLGKWKKSLSAPIVLLAVATDSADHSFLKSYTEMEQIFYVGKQEEMFSWFMKYAGENPDRNLNPEEELWKVIRDCFLLKK